MSDVTIVGLGLMGTALVGALRQAGYKLTIWNRSSDKTEKLLGDGVMAVSTVAEAVGASPVVIICIDAPNATKTVLDSDLVLPNLRERIIIQLSTCLPEDAREAESWLHTKSAEYLDGAILCAPQDVGTKNGQILLSGRGDTYEKVRKIVGCLGDKVEFLGANIGSASTLTLAWLSTRFGRFMGIVHAANICRSEGVDLMKFTSLFPGDDQIQHHGGTIRDASYETRSATLDVWHSSLKLLLAQADDAKINDDFPRLVDVFFDKAVTTGYGDEHVMAIFKVLRGSYRS